MIFGVLWAVGRRPRLWGTALRQAWTMRPSDGWLPPREYLSFRLETAYGNPNARPEPGDVVAWLEWCANLSGSRPPSGALPRRSVTRFGRRTIGRRTSVGGRSAGRLRDEPIVEDDGRGA